MSRHLDGTGSAHPILQCLDVVERALDEAVDAATWSLDGPDTTQVLTRIAADLARLAELEARTLHHAETLGVPEELGVRSLSAWLARQTRVTRPEAARKVRLATTLASHRPTREAMARGELHAEQAVAIGRAVDDLGPEHAEHHESAEKHLIEQAADFDASKVAVLGRRVLEVIDPARADEHEATLLEAQERRAWKKTSLRLCDDGEGMTHGHFTIPAAQGSMLRKALQSFAAPKHVRATDGAGSYDYTKPTPDKLGKAFCDYIERFPRHRLPKMGGMSATVVVTADHGILAGLHKAAHLDTGVAVSPGQLRRWACEARLFPAVLDTDDHVLSLGRSARFHTEAQRLALIVEQKTCQHPACDVAGAFCHVHHIIAWHKGGPTDTIRAVLLCPFHHHQTHATGATYPMRT